MTREELMRRYPDGKDETGRTVWVYSPYTLPQLDPMPRTAPPKGLPYHIIPKEGPIQWGYCYQCQKRSIRWEKVNKDGRLDYTNGETRCTCDEHAATQGAYGQTKD